MRLAKYLASAGLGSRRNSEKIITDGEILVNGRRVTDAATEINPAEDIVVHRGSVVSPKKLVYYLLNKPRGYTTTKSDPHAKHLITELVPDEPPVWPVGRLDRETTGLIVMTNDGDLTEKLTHPRHEKAKEYLVQTNLGLTDKEIGQIREGVTLDDGLMKVDLFEKTAKDKYKIVIHSGKKRIIRRLIAFFGKEVISLERRRIANLKIGSLKVGQHRLLSKGEIEEIKRNV